MEGLAHQEEITEPDADVRATLHQEFIRAFKDCRSSSAIEKQPRFLAYREAIRRSLNEPEIFLATPSPRKHSRSFLRVACWNLERGTHFEAIVRELKSHAFLADHDLLLVTEVDHGMARSGNRHITKELAEVLGMHAVFGPSHLNFDMGNGPEAKRSKGENTVALQGHALFSRYPLREVELIPLPEPKDLMHSQDERQFGHENAILATVNTPLGDLHVVVNHLSARSSRRQRAGQMKCILQALAQRPGPALIGGDWNTHTYNTHCLRGMILGGLHRYFSGIEKTLTRFYPEPDRYFEKGLFQTLKNFGFSHESFNVLNATTVHYNFTEPEKLLHMEDWVPKWCLPPLLRALRGFRGQASLKLDWFAGRDLGGSNSRIIFDLPKGATRISDHDPIMVDIHFQKEGHA